LPVVATGAAVPWAARRQLDWREFPAIGPDAAADGVVAAVSR